LQRFVELHTNPEYFWGVFVVWARGFPASDGESRAVFPTSSIGSQFRHTKSPAQ
jgi:hypothetical protein